MLLYYFYQCCAEFIGYLQCLCSLPRKPRKNDLFRNSQAKKIIVMVKPAHRLQGQAALVTRPSVWWEHVGVVHYETVKTWLNNLYWSQLTTNDQFELCIDRKTSTIHSKTWSGNFAGWQRIASHSKSRQRSVEITWIGKFYCTCPTL